MVLPKHIINIDVPDEESIYTFDPTSTTITVVNDTECEGASDHLSDKECVCTKTIVYSMMFLFFLIFIFF